MNMLHSYIVTRCIGMIHEILTHKLIFFYISVNKQLDGSKLKKSEAELWFSLMMAKFHFIYQEINQHK